MSFTATLHRSQPASRNRWRVRARRCTLSYASAGALTIVATYSGTDWFASSVPAAPSEIVTSTQCPGPSPAPTWLERILSGASLTVCEPERAELEQGDDDLCACDGCELEREQPKDVAASGVNLANANLCVQTCRCKPAGCEPEPGLPERV